MDDGSQANISSDARKSSLIRPRPKASPLIGLVLSLLFAATATPIIMADELLFGSDPMAAQTAASHTVRIPPFNGHQGAEAGFLGQGSIVVSRGEIISSQKAQSIAAIRSSRGDFRITAGAFFLVMLLLSLLLTTHMRRSHLGRLLRSQVGTLLQILSVAAVVKAVVLLTPVSVLLVPVAAFALVAMMTVDVSVGIATGFIAASLMACLVPFDQGVLCVLIVQAITPTLLLGERFRGKIEIVLAGAFGGVAAAVSYLIFYYLAWRAVPVGEFERPLHSAWVAAAVGGPLSAVLAIAFAPVYQIVLGGITRNRLVELEDLSNPLLRQIAEKAPGSWQHSLAMANMAELATNAIGANGRLVRVGAYYHDLGKSLQPKYFIENLPSGESSPHDSLDPDVSCDAIFAHVTEGVRLGRERGLPERVIDFMHMHHGDGRLEYFWKKCQDDGNPKNLTEGYFRYPGLKPQSKETAILAIVDAVEAASRTLRSPDTDAIRNLVQRIVYGKLHLGQLDESGLEVADLRKISDSLMDTIKHAHHGRIEYPWQKEERARREAEKGEREDDTPQPKRPSSTTSQFIREPRLDSLDAPRPYWRRKKRESLGNAKTEKAIRSDVDTDPLSATVPVMPLPEDRPADGIPADEAEGRLPPAPPGATRQDAPVRELTSTAETTQPARPPRDTIELMGEDHGTRPPKTTIELMGGDDGQLVPGQGEPMVEGDVAAGELAAGVITVGPPPATKKRSAAATDE